MSCFIRSGVMNFSNSCVPFGIAPIPSAIVMVIRRDQAVALGVDRISSPFGASRFANSLRNCCGSAVCSITSIVVIRSNAPGRSSIAETR